MPTPAPIEYKDASAEVRAVFDDIKRSRNVPDVNNFWKYLARDPALLKRTWESVKEVMAPGALDPLTKEMIYLAVSVTNGCAYCIASHGAAARKAGMSEAMFGELMAVTGMANETNRLANGYRVPVDPMFETDVNAQVTSRAKSRWRARNRPWRIAASARPDGFAQPQRSAAVGIIVGQHLRELERVADHQQRTGAPYAPRSARGGEVAAEADDQDGADQQRETTRQMLS